MNKKEGVLTVVAVLVLILIVCGAFIPEDYFVIYGITLDVLLVPLGVLAVIFCRCPHCDSFLWPRKYGHYGDCCPYCGESLHSGEEVWSVAFEELNYLQGSLEVFEDRAETMLMVTYKDGMYIHVGYDEAESEFVITVYENDSEAAKASPLAVHRVFGHSNLLATLQKTVHTWRDDKIDY